jgi:hypothetical protein
MSLRDAWRGEVVVFFSVPLLRFVLCLYYSSRNVSAVFGSSKVEDLTGRIRMCCSNLVEYFSLVRSSTDGCRRGFRA